MIPYWVADTVKSVVIALGLGIVVSGCQIVPGSGPSMRGAAAASTETLAFDVIDLTPATVVSYRPLAIVDRASKTSTLSAIGRVRVAPGDVLKVRIFEAYTGGIFPTLQNPGADLGTQRVADDGTINVPYVGAVRVAGLDIGEVEGRITQQLGSKAKNPQVIVEIASDRTHTVMVSGDVKNPGRISLLDGVRSVVDAVNRAGGLATSSAGNSFNSPPTSRPSTGSAAAASQFEVVVRRQGHVILQEQYSDLLAGDDIGIQKDDEIVVRPNSRSLTVLGAVRISGNVPMTKQNITLVEALGQVGGLADERANKTGVFVFRMGDIQASPTTRARIFRLDLSDPASMFVAQQFGMQTRDVVYVTNAPLYEYNKVLSSMYLTFAAIGVAKGTIIPATVF